MAKKSATFNKFLVHFSIVVGTLILMLYLFFYVYLPSMTHHGEAIEVPNFRNKSLLEIDIEIKKVALRYKIFDSTYLEGMKPLQVINQFPKSGEKVKLGRTIYLTITARNPPGVKMPQLVGNSLKSAELTLKSFGLILGSVKYMPNPNVGAVLSQSHNGKKIEGDFQMKKGMIIDLVVGSGLSDVQVLVPNLVGLSLIDAKKMLQTQGLELGIVSNVENSTFQENLICKQKPAFIAGDTTNKLKKGEIVDLWISGKKAELNSE